MYIWRYPNLALELKIQEIHYVLEKELNSNLEDLLLAAYLIACETCHSDFK